VYFMLGGRTCKLLTDSVLNFPDRTLKFCTLCQILVVIMYFHKVFV
jgi:hypothetical protein